MVRGSNESGSESADSVYTPSFSFLYLSTNFHRLAATAFSPEQLGVRIFQRDSLDFVVGLAFVDSLFLACERRDGESCHTYILLTDT